MDSLRDRYNTFVSEHIVAWELTFALLAVAFVVVGFVETPWAQNLDLALTGVFVLEFASRFSASRSRASYLRSHWIDLLALIPTVRGVRILRLVRLLRLVRAFAGIGRSLESLERMAQHRGLVWLLTAWAAVMVLCSIGLYAAENGVNAAVSSPLDALWWGISTMTTVGYGDVTPVTAEGRVAAAVLMVLGIGLFSAVTATLTSFLLETERSPIEDLGRLADLRDRGVLTETEFERARKPLIAKLGPNE